MGFFLVGVHLLVLVGDASLLKDDPGPLDVRTELRGSGSALALWPLSAQLRLVRDLL